MAVIVTDLRTVVNEADSITGWNTGDAVTDIFAEATHSIATGQLGTVQIYYTGTAIDLSNHLIYVYAFNNAIQSTWTDANPPVALHIGDGSNRVSFKMAGGDKKVFVHADGPTDWQNLVLDTSEASTMNTDGLTTVRAGSFAGLNFSALTQFGGDYTTLSKALGGGYNTATDIIRVGNDGLRITGGTTGDRGNFFEIVLEDRSTANLKAHGLIREYSTGFYGVQGPLNFGNTTGTSWFDDTSATLIFENRNIGNDKYYIRVWGGTGDTNFLLRNSTITTAGPFVTCLFNDDNIDSLELRSVNFNNLGNNISFANDTPAETHVVNLCNFNGCGQIDPGKVNFTNNNISGSTAGETGAILLDGDGAENWSNLNFSSAGTGHAIYITTPGSYTLTNMSYSGYGADGTTDAVVYNNSGGLVTLTISGGSSPTVRNGTGASTELLTDPRTFTLTGIQEDSKIKIVRISDNETLASTTSSGTTFSYVHQGGDIPVRIIIFHLFFLPVRFDSTLVDADQSIPVFQIFDRQYDNPD